MDIEPYQPSFGPLARIRRRWTASRVVAPLGRRPKGLWLSVSFDDAPLSAALNGAPLVETAGAVATWYIATGLLGALSAGGPIVDATTVRRLAGDGHEIALHGHAHADMDRMPTDRAVADIMQNRDALAQIIAGAPAPHLAYPYGTTSLALKRRLKDMVATARGVRGGINAQDSDLMQLEALDLRPDPPSHLRAVAAMENAARDGGWVILFTHDVTAEPGPFGVTPDVLRGLLSRARDLGATILPVGQAFEHMATLPQHTP